jgi:transposase
MKAMTTRITTPTMKVVRAVSPVRIPRPTKKVRPLTKEEAIKRIGAMKGLNGSAKGKLINRVKMGKMSPRRVVKVARELSRLNAPGYRVEL